jgi:predicted phosphodiesterase
MELVTIPHVDGPHCNLVIMSDLHTGCANWQEDLLDQDISAIESDPYARVVLPGDLFQRDLKNHKVGDVYRQKIPPGEQKYYLRDKLDKIKYKIIGACGGNHDDRGQEDTNEVRDLCEFLGVRYFEDEICVSIPVGAKAKNGKPCVYTGYGIHGSSNGSTVGALANSLAKLPNVCDADFYFCGHSHQPLWFPLSWFRRDLYNQKMTHVIRHFVAAGSYQGREKYPVVKALTPKVMGSPIVRLGGSDKEITVFLPNKC